jgi:hypothetical protein
MPQRYDVVGILAASTNDEPAVNSVESVSIRVDAVRRWVRRAAEATVTTVPDEETD